MHSQQKNKPEFGTELKLQQLQSLFKSNKLQLKHLKALEPSKAEAKKSIFNYLSAANLLNESNRKVIYHCSHIVLLDHLLELVNKNFKETGCSFDQYHFDALLKCKNYNDLAKTLYELERSPFYDKDTLNAVISQAQFSEKSWQLLGPSIYSKHLDKELFLFIMSNYAKQSESAFLYYLHLCKVNNYTKNNLETMLRYEADLSYKTYMNPTKENLDKAIKKIKLKKMLPLLMGTHPRVGALSALSIFRHSVFITTGKAIQDASADKKHVFSIIASFL